MSYSSYQQKAKDREREIGACRHFNRCKGQISNAFSVLSSLHNLHFGWLFV